MTINFLILSLFFYFYFFFLFPQPTHRDLSLKAEEGVVAANIVKVTLDWEPIQVKLDPLAVLVAIEVSRGHHQEAQLDQQVEPVRIHPVGAGHQTGMTRISERGFPPGLVAF